MPHGPVTRSTNREEGQNRESWSDESLSGTEESTQVADELLLGTAGSTQVNFTTEQLFQLELKKMEMKMEKDRMQMEREREIDKREFEAKLERERAQRERENLELKTLLENERSVNVSRSAYNGERDIKLIALKDDDDIDIYLRTFEKIATTNKWVKDQWVIRLVPALTGKAREAYVSLSAEDTTNYDKLKQAIFQRYKLNAETYRKKFRASSRKPDETYTEWVTRMTDLFQRWAEAEKAESVDQIKQIMLKEQAFDKMPRDLSLWIREKQPDTVVKLGELADEYTAIRGGHQNLNAHANVFKPYQKPIPQQNNSTTSAPRPNTTMRSKFTKCFNCHKFGHFAAECRAPKSKPTGGVFWCNSQQVHNSEVIPRHGKTLLKPYETFGTLNGRKVLILRDTGCTHSVANENIVPLSAYTKRVVNLTGIEGQTRSLPVAHVFVDCEYFKGWLDIAVHPTIERELLLGNEIGDAWERSLSCKTNIPQQDSQELKEESALIITRSKQKMLDKQKEYEKEEAKNSGVLSKTIELATDKTQPEIVSDSINNTNNVKKQSESVGDSEIDTNCDENCHNYEPEKGRMSTENVNLPSDPESLRKLQLEDITLAGIRDKAQIENQVRHERVAFFFRDGLVYRKWSSRHSKNGNKYEQIIVPEVCRTEILRLAHEIPFAGHLGIEKTKDRILQNFYWPGIFADIAKYCRSCTECQKTARKRQSDRVPLISLPIIDTPFKRIGIDILGPLPRSKAGNRYILVMCDYSTRYPEAIPMANQETETIAQSLIKFFSQVGIPEEIISDQGSNFMARLLKRICEKLCIDRIQCSPYYKGSNGLVERFNGTLRQMLRKYAKDDPLMWDTYIPYLLFAYREVPHESTGFSPFELLYGRVREQDVFLGALLCGVGLQCFLSVFKYSIIQT